MSTSRDGSSNRQRPEEQRIDNRKDRRVAADPDAQRQDGDGGKAGAAEEPADGVTDVLDERVEHDDELYVGSWFVVRRSAFRFEVLGSGSGFSVLVQGSGFRVRNDDPFATRGECQEFRV